MISKEKLKEYALKLMFDMDEKEYTILIGEFEIMLKQMEVMEKTKGINEVIPMTFPFVTYKNSLREDKEEESLEVEEVLLNAKYTSNDQVKVPKVVE